MDGAVEGLSLTLSPRASYRGEALAVASTAAAVGEGQPPGEDLAEGLSKFRVEDGVDDRVEGRIRVAQPRQDLERRNNIRTRT